MHAIHHKAKFHLLVFRKTLAFQRVKPVTSAITSAVVHVLATDNAVSTTAQYCGVVRVISQENENRKHMP